MLDFLLDLDRSLFIWIHRDSQSDFLDWLFPIWRDKKTWLPLYVLMFVFFTWRYTWAVWRVVLALVLAVASADLLSSRLFKPWFARLRPCREPDLSDWHRYFTDCSSGYSFVSSHAANHFALALMLYFILARDWGGRMASYLALLWAASIAYAQVYVGVHYPLDVVFGAILGLALAWFWRYVLRSRSHWLGI